MAFTTAQLAAIRQALGLPSVYLFLDPALEGVMQVVGNDADASALVVTALAGIQNVLAQIANVALVSTGVKAMGNSEVELYEHNQQLEGLRKIGRMYCGQISNIMGVRVANDMFGSSGYSGHGWAKGQQTNLAGMS
jgi:hypothetical protein